MNEDIITIVIPVYNAAKTLDKCIDSIVNQTYEKWKLILINDGSLDNSEEICKKWVNKDNRISLYNQVNSGPGSARNHGIIKANTKWITFIDADDKILNNYLENFHCSDIKEKDISIQGYSRISISGKFLNEEKEFINKYYKNTNQISNSFNKDKLLEYGLILGKLYPLSIIKENNIFFPTDFRLSEDHLFYIKVLYRIEGIRTNAGKFYHYIDWETSTNITKQSFSIDEAISRFISLRDAFKVLVSRFTNIDQTTINWINYFVYTVGISFIINRLYKNKLSTQKRNEVLHWLNNKEDPIINYFNPHSIPGKGLKFIISKFPSSLANMIIDIFL